MKRGGILFKILMVPLLLAFGLFFHISIVSGDYPIEQFSLNSGREIFDSNCAVCHGEKGDGSVFKGAFDFTNNERMITNNSSVFFDADLIFLICRKGLSGWNKLKESRHFFRYISTATGSLSGTVIQSS